MDGPTIAITFIGLAILALPFILDWRARKTKRERLLRAMHAMAQEDQCVIHRHTLIGDRILGLDEERKILYFLVQDKDNSLSTRIALGGMKRCLVVKAWKPGHKAGGGTPPIKVELCLQPNGHEEKEKRLVLYEDPFGIPSEGHLLVPDQWAQQINSLLNLG